MKFDLFEKFDLFKEVENTLDDQENEEELRKKLISFRFKSSEPNTVVMSFISRNNDEAQIWKKYCGYNDIFEKETSYFNMEYHGWDLLDDAEEAFKKDKRSAMAATGHWDHGKPIEVHGQSDMICIKYQDKEWRHYGIFGAEIEWLGF